MHSSIINSVHSHFQSIRSEKDVNAAGQGTASSAGWAGWAVSGMTSLTSKIYAGKKQVSTGHVATKASDDPKQGESMTKLSFHYIITFS